MTPVNGNLDETLRRVLHAEVDSVEPAEGGLDQIRRRTHAPWLVRQASLMLTECVDLIRLIGIRLEPSVTSMRATVVARGGLWAAFAGMLSSIVARLMELVMPSRRRGGMHRGGQTASDGPSPERPPSHLAWLRPVLAVVGAVVIVVAGVFGLTQVRDNLVLELFHSSSPSSSGPGTSSTSNQVPTLQGQSAPGVILPASPGAGSPRPSPTATCSSKASNRQSTPTPTPTNTTPAATPSSTPTPTPTDTTSPSPTATAATSALSVNGGTGIQTVVNVAPDESCASPAHSTASS